jgi:hypothetical protein
MQSSQDQNQIATQPIPNPIPLRFDEKFKPQKEQDSEVEESNPEHDHGKSHSGL